MSQGRRKSSALLSPEKNTPQNQKTQKTSTVSEAGVAQFPSVLSDLGGNAENQANS